MVAGVPENQLKSIARMAMTGNFLSEPVPGQVSHNATSSLFVTNPSINGWALFMAENSCPGALAMVGATEKYGVTDKKNETAFNVARNTDLPFFDYIGQHPEQGKQFAAYMKNVLASEGTKVGHLVNGFDWASLGEATVVDVSIYLDVAISTSDLLTDISIKGRRIPLPRNHRARIRISSTQIHRSRSS